MTLPQSPRSASRSFPVRITGPLDLNAVEHVRFMLGRLGGDTESVVLHCDGVSSVDPAAAACLWDLCREAEHRGTGRIRLDGLPPRFVNRLRLHPLRQYLASEDDPFSDPFERAAPSER